MKKLLIIALFVLSFCSIDAQSIKFRRLLDPQGISVMTTTLKVFPWGQRALEYALQFDDSEEEGLYRGYSLNIYFTTNDKSLYIPPKGKVLIRTTKGEVISLEDVGDEYFTEYDTELDVLNRQRRSISYLDKTFNDYRYTVHGKYAISVDDLQKLMSDGVIKIRIETTGEPVQCEYNADKKNKTAEVIQKLFDELESNRDPYNNF